MDPIINQTSARKIVNLLPNLSEIGPPKNDPMAAPTNVKDTISSLSTLEIF